MGVTWRLVRVATVLIPIVVEVGCGSVKQTDIGSDRTAAAIAIRQGRCADALGPLDRILIADPADLRTRRSRASCYLQLHQFGHAIDDFHSIAAVDQSSAALIDLATAQWAAGETEAAKASLRKGATVTSDQTTLLLIASNQNLYGDPESASSTLMKIPSTYRDFRWFVQLGQIDEAQVDPGPFESDLGQALRIAPKADKGQIYSALADGRWKRGDYAAALDGYQQAISSPGAWEHVHVYATMADCYVHLGRLDDAASKYRSALAAGPDEDFRETLSLSLAKTLIQLGHNSDAVHLLDQLLARTGVSADTRQQAEALRTVAVGG